MIFTGRNQIPFSYGRYGYTRGGGKTWHGGQDIVGLDDAAVCAVEGGRVLRSRIVTDKRNKTWEWGNYVTIQTASGEQHIYAHLAARSVQAGETVAAGQKIGVMGNTGNAAGGYKHVHFERRKPDGKTAIDPAAKSGCANRVGTYGAAPSAGGANASGAANTANAAKIAPLSPEACVLLVGPASAGDVRTLQTLAASLRVDCNEAGGMLSIGPVTPGDQVTVLTKAAELGLPVTTAQPHLRIEIAADSLRVRTGPGTDEFKQAGSVHAGAQYDVLDRCGAWYYIETDGLDGWVSGEYCRAL